LPARRPIFPRNRSTASLRRRGCGTGSNRSETKSLFLSAKALAQQANSGWQPSIPIETFPIAEPGVARNRSA
jgi:hypothetical protein